MLWRHKANRVHCNQSLYVKLCDDYAARDACRLDASSRRTLD